MAKNRLAGALAALVLIAGVLPALAQARWNVTKTMTIGGSGAWDYLTVDPQTRRLYVTRTTHTMVLDADSGKLIADIPGQKRAHGVALAPEVGRGFISDGGGEGGIVIFDLKTNQVLGTIAAQPDADGIIYDPSSRLVLCVSGDGNTLLSLKPDIDPRTGKMDAPIALGGSPEFLAADGKGKAFVNLMDKNEVAVVDLAARKVIARWPVAPGGVPIGLAMDRKQRRLFIGCRKPQKMVVMNADNGKVLADFPIGAGVDATAFDSGFAFASAGDGTLTIVKETSPDKFELVQTLNTAAGARTMGAGPKTNTVYLPTAEFEAAKAGGRPSAKPGTFKIVVVSAK